MRDAARAAAMSDPDQNRWFRRRWVDAVARNCSTPPGHAQPLPLSQNNPDTFELTGRKLLAAWRHERAAQAEQSEAGCITVRGGR